MIKTNPCKYLYVLYAYYVSHVCKQTLFCGNPGAVVSAVHGGDVVCDRRQKDTAGVCVTEHVHL